MDKILEGVMFQAINNSPRVMEITKDIKASGLDPRDYICQKAHELEINLEKLVRTLQS